MTYSENELQQIEKYASIYLKISDIAVILDIPADVLRSDIADRGTDVSKAYRRGKAASKVKLHSQEMMLAQVGSPLAIENAHRNLLDMEDDELKKPQIRTLCRGSWLCLLHRPQLLSLSTSHSPKCALFSAWRGSTSAA